MIIEILREIHAKHRLAIGDVSTHTKSAQLITKEWQQSVCSGNIKAEVKVSPTTNGRIDIVDFTKLIAYELKVSGNNPNHEFYKDIFKVLTYNEYVESTQKLSKLIFISESKGIESLSKSLDEKLLSMFERKHGLSVELVSI